MSSSEQAPSSLALLDPALAALLHLARMASHQAGAQEVLPALVQAAVRQLGAEAAAAVRLDASSVGTVVAAAGEPLTGVRVDVEALDRSVGERLHAACRRSYAAVHTLPLASDSDLFGALVLFFDRADALDARNLKFASGLTELAATSLAKAARYEALERALAQRNQAQAKLRATVDHLQALIDTAGSVILFLSPEGTVLEFNHAAAELHGCSREDAIGKDYLMTFVPDAGREAARTELAHVLGGGRTRGFEHEVLTQKGQPRTLLWNADRLVDEHGATIGVVAVGQDITERKRLQAELIHAQKLEALGQLATGVAHDFNNVLTIITGLADVALTMLPVRSEAHACVGEVKAAGLRGAALTKQLKAFGRPRAAVEEIVDLNQAVKSSEMLLRQAVRHRVELVLRPDADDARVRVDAGQLEQVLLNLVLNARDAMPEGGTVSVATAVEAGVVVLAVSDSGVGMSDEVKQRVFEPFFTTKGERGTGIGLSMVRGFVDQSGAQIGVESSPGRGTTFRIRFPHADRPATRASGTPRGHNEVVLLVAAERLRPWLEEAGYRVISAATGTEAAAVLDDAEREVHVLITAPHAPRISGFELAHRRELPVIYTSAHSDLLDDARVGSASVLIEPFERETLLRELARTIGRAARAAGPATVLVVDDQESARRALRLLLSDRYDILEAASGEAALEQLECDKLDVLLTDIDLGSMPVATVVAGVRARFPRALVVYMSGYESSDPRVIEALRVPRSTFVSKPIDIDTLAATIDGLLTRERRLQGHVAKGPNHEGERFS